MKTLTILFLFLSSTCRKEPLPEKYNIVLCVGQSNMLGSTPIEPEDNGSLAWLWNNNGWERADGHLNRYSDIANVYGGLSMVNSFGKESARRSKQLTGLVVNARGGSFIETWDTLYLAMSIRRLNEALAHNPGNRVTAVLWHQGESNVVYPHEWMTSFVSIRRQVDSLIGHDVPILVGGLSIVHYRHRVMNDSMKTLETDPRFHDCYFVSSDTMTVNGVLQPALTTTDGTHFDSESQRTFGLRYYQVYKSIF